MKCDEIKERLVELLYEGEGSTDARLQDHVRACPQCRQELAELKNVRSLLGRWEDEPPLRPVETPRAAPEARPRAAFSFFQLRFLRYAAVAALLAVAVLALANAEIRWDRNGFSFQTHLFSAAPSSDYYTKAEVLDLLKKVVDDSEYRMTETNFLMMQKMMDTVEEDRMMDLRLIRNRIGQRGRN